MSATLPELRAWLTLVRARGIGPATASMLLETYGSAEQSLGAGKSAWRSLGLNAAQIEALQKPDEEGIAEDLAWLEAGGQRGFIPLTDSRYPARLRAVAHAPIGLFYLGDAALLTLPQLAIVGARNATPQGLENAHAFAKELCRHGLVVTSGLALGIDAAAHRGALEAKGQTIAVCATGLDRVYPARHRALAHQIAQQGVLVSEFPVGVQALAENFPRRNRIISGLSLGTLVVEAARESGSLITARYAMEQGREVFAIPGSIHNPMARGCHQLIRQGVKLTEVASDILEELAPQIGAALKECSSSPDAVATPDDTQAALLGQLGDRALSLDQLVDTTGLGVGDLSARLLQLELSGHVARTATGQYMKIR